MRRRHSSGASAGQADDMEGVHYWHGLRDLLGGGLEPGEPVHDHGLDAGSPGLGLFGEPGLEHGLGASLNHVEEPGRAGFLMHAGEMR